MPNLSTPGIEDLNKRLTKVTLDSLNFPNDDCFKDEEWLKEFELNLKKSNHVAENVSRILDNFNQQVDALKDGVAPLYDKTTVIQKKQQS